MKYRSRSLLGIVLAVAILISLAFSFHSTTASALSPDYDYLSTVYYLFDYYPTIDKTQFDYSFPGYEITYDRQNCSDISLVNLIQNGYFDGFYGMIFVVDIKLCQNDPTILAALFSAIKSTGCVTIFVSPYNPTDYSDDSFMDFVDHHVPSDFGRLTMFFENIWGLSGNTSPGVGTQSGYMFMIDAYAAGTFDGSVYQSCENYDTDDYCQSPFMQHLVSELISHFADEDYTPTLTDLYVNHNVVIYVQIGETLFVNIFTYETFNTQNTTSFPARDIAVQENRFAMGITNLTSGFYSYLYGVQNACVAGYMNVCLLEGMPALFGENGLTAILWLDFSSEPTLLCNEVAWLTEVFAMYLA